MTSARCQVAFCACFCSHFVYCIKAFQFDDLLSAGSLELSHFYLLWGHSRLGTRASFSCAREIVQSRRSSLGLQHIKICVGPSELLFAPGLKPGSVSGNRVGGQCCFFKAAWDSHPF